MIHEVLNGFQGVLLGLFIILREITSLASCINVLYTEQFFGNYKHTATERTIW